MSKKSILIVDDSATARLLFKVSLESLDDYTVFEANDWESALKSVQESNPEIIVLDYNMPEKVGIEVAKEILALGHKPHFILLTANTQDSIVDEATQLGFLGVVEKPVSADTLMPLLDKIS